MGGAYPPSKKNEVINIISKVVLLPDIHYPHHNKEAVKAVFQFIKWFKPHAINLIGDAMNMDAVDYWKKKQGDNKHFENKRLQEDYKNFDRDILVLLEKLIPRDCEKTYMGGNHEAWINIVTNKDPTLTGIVEPEILLHLKERDWEWIPWIKNNKRGIKPYGKLLTFHGIYTNKYHAAKTADTFSKSCAYGHTHDIQSYTKVTVDDYKGFHTAQSIGCLCDLSPEFMRGSMNRWVNSFGVLFVREDGMYNLYVPVIIRGKFTFAGKTFDGGKS